MCDWNQQQSGRGWGGSHLPHWLENDFNSSLKSQSAQKWCRCPGCHLRSLFMHNKIGKVPIRIAAWKAHFCSKSSFNSAENEKYYWEVGLKWLASSFLHVVIYNLLCFLESRTVLSASRHWPAVGTEACVAGKMLVNDSTWMIYVGSLFKVCVLSFRSKHGFVFFSLTCTKCYLNDKDRRQALEKKTKQNLIANKPHYDEGSYRYTDRCVYYFNFASTSYKWSRAG